MSIETLTFDELRSAVESAAAFRCRRRLQPAGGAGDKVFPPTFAGAVYGIETRRVAGRQGAVQCVLLDSVQSQANRMEQALQEAMDAGRLTLPHVVVDFSEYDPVDGDACGQGDRFIDAVGKLTSLQVPHRLADAILRDSLLDGEPFRSSDRGKALNRASVANATPIFELSPTALVFGMWDSTGPKGGLGARFERAMVSEIVGIEAEWHGDYRARGVRRDPLEIRKTVKVVKNADATWALADEEERTTEKESDKEKSKKGKDKSKKKSVAPSEINHSSVPFDSANCGVTVEYAEQTTTLSLIVLRRLRFPVNGAANPETDVAARTVLAALGLTAATLAFAPGMALRSRCLLWPEGPMIWELLSNPGESPARFRLCAESAIELLKMSVDAARKTGLPWPDEPVQLKPSSDLVELVRRSQLEAVKEEPAEEKEDANGQG